MASRILKSSSPTQKGKTFSDKQVIGLLNDVQRKPCAKADQHDFEYRLSQITGTSIPVCKHCKEEFPPVFYARDIAW